MGRVLHEVVEVTRDCEVGEKGERAVVTGLSTEHMTLLFPDRPFPRRKVHTGADYAFLRTADAPRLAGEPSEADVARLTAYGYSRGVALALVPVFDAMQPLEELGGPDAAEYLVVMEAIANEARRRAETLRGNMPAAPVLRSDGVEMQNASRFTIELAIDGDADDAADVLDYVLDGGTLQDAITEYAQLHGHDLSVVSAVVK